jgi:hypothetical protein
MSKEEKEAIYESLVDLTRRAEAENIFFSRNDILKNIKENLESDGLSVVYYRSLCDIEGKIKDLDHRALPRKLALSSCLEELSEEGMVDKIILSAGIDGKPSTLRYYRAVEDTK